MRPVIGVEGDLCDYDCDVEGRDKSEKNPVEDTHKGEVEPGGALLTSRLGANANRSAGICRARLQSRPSVALDVRHSKAIEGC